MLAQNGGLMVDATRQQFPRIAEIPFDGAYKLMATFRHTVNPEGDLLQERKTEQYNRIQEVQKCHAWEEQEEEQEEEQQEEEAQGGRNTGPCAGGAGAGEGEGACWWVAWFCWRLVAPSPMALSN